MRLPCFQEELMQKQESMFPRLAKARYFIKIDLPRGFWQTKRKKLNVLAFGLASVPVTSSSFTKQMRQLTRGRESVITYLDDMLISHTSLQGIHICEVRHILERIRQFGFT